jgi:endonuclease III
LNLREYPREILDLVIFHKIHLHLDRAEAFQAFRRLKHDFVDWNEVRISSIREIQEVLGPSEDGLEMAVFIKNFLEFVHQEFRRMDLEFLAEQSNAEIRKFFKQVRGLDASTIHLILRLRKDYPVLPVNARMESTLTRVGVVRPRDNREQKGKFLHGLVNADLALPFHHFFLQHSRKICPPDESRLQCAACGIRSSCHYYERKVLPKLKRLKRK